MFTLSLGGGCRPIRFEPRRERQRRHAAQRALARGGHGATVEHVVAQVCAVIQAREHEVWPARQDARTGVERGVNAVSRSAVDGKHAVPVGREAQRPMQAQ
jgi:hypothetical protein